MSRWRCGASRGTGASRRGPRPHLAAPRGPVRGCRCSRWRLAGPDPLREGLVSAEPTDVGAERVGRRDNRGKDAQHTQDAQKVLAVDRPGPGFDVSQGLAVDPGALGGEGSGQAVELAPGAYVLAEVSQCTRNLDGCTSNHRLTSVS